MRYVVKRIPGIDIWTVFDCRAQRCVDNFLTTDRPVAQRKADALNGNAK